MSLLPGSVNGTLSTQSFNPLVAEQCDRFLQALSKVVFSRRIRNVGVVKFAYSINIHLNKISDFIYLNLACPSLLILPLFNDYRITMAIFFIPQRKVGFFDTLKHQKPETFIIVKFIIEKHLGFEFAVIDQNEINDKINENCQRNFANLHIFRIAEEICFTGSHKKLNYFNIYIEAERIQKILVMILDPNWRGEWIQTFQETRLDNIVEAALNLINNSTTVSDSIDDISVAGIGEDTNINGRSTVIVVSDMDDRSVIVVEDINNVIFTDPTSIPSTASTSTLPPSATAFTASQFDKFFQCCSNVALTKTQQNIGVVSCQYSSNVYINKISDFIYLVKPNPSIIIVPLFHSGRISLAVFYISNKRIGYYDSLRQPPIYSLSFAKSAIEKYLKCLFTLVNHEITYATINHNPVPELANFHACRIAEEICFNGRNQKLPQFDVILESQRIKQLIRLVMDKSWKGEWIANLHIPSSSNQRIEVVERDFVQGRDGGVRDEITALASIVDAFDGSSGSGSNKNVVVNVSSSIPTSIRRSQSRDKERQDVIQVTNKMLNITQTSMTDFNAKYPIIAKMLNCYLNFTKRRNDRYCRSEKACTLQKVFNWKIYTQMDHKDMEEALITFCHMPFFVELSETDKMALFRRFWAPFSMLERIYDSLNTLDSLKDENLIVLQNGSIFELDGLCKSANPTSTEKITFEAWKTLLPVMKKMEPHCLEMMYIFCCILWNSSYLKFPLSPEGEELIRRGRLIIHGEMREFYGYDEIQWERIYVLRRLLLAAERSVNEEIENA